MTGEKLDFFSFLYIKLFELGAEEDTLVYSFAAE